VQVHAIRAGAARRIERFNDDRMARVALGETREVTFRGALGDDVQMFVTFPPRFDPRRKHPVLQVIHGGPYTAAGDTFGYRWNTHLFASRGYVVAAVNYHGSSGFGFAFRDGIMGRQGRLETEDIEAATDWLVAKPWADRRRVFAAGGSYGGFLVAWMNGHVPAGRYQAYVCHAGAFDRILTFSADSYLHRPKDLHASYWEKPAKVRSQSPSSFAHRMATPTLVIHGNNDYRVPDANGLAYYNLLQARGVPARLVWFPDENHWVLKPRNSRLWYAEFFDWLAAHDPGGLRCRGR
jgi:dipeptidyl aminopeptidase/acylaminoacyl peptidase